MAACLTDLVKLSCRATRFLSAHEHAENRLLGVACKRCRLTGLFQVKRRGLGSNLMFATICVIFGVLNLACLAADLLCCAVGLTVVRFDSGRVF